MVEDADFQRRLARKIIEMSLSVRETEKAVKRVKERQRKVLKIKRLSQK